MGLLDKLKRRTPEEQARRDEERRAEWAALPINPTGRRDMSPKTETNDTEGNGKPRGWLKTLGTVGMAVGQDVIGFKNTVNLLHGAFTNRDKDPAGSDMTADEVINKTPAPPTTPKQQAVQDAEEEAIIRGQELGYHKDSDAQARLRTEILDKHYKRIILSRRELGIEDEPYMFDTHTLSQSAADPQGEVTADRAAIDRAAEHTRLAEELSQDPKHIWNPETKEYEDMSQDLDLDSSLHPDYVEPESQELGSSDLPPPEDDPPFSEGPIASIGEGEGEGNITQTNRNPFNVKYIEGGVANQYALKDADGNPVRDKFNHLIFPDDEAGWAGGRADITAKIRGDTAWGLSSESTLDAFGKVYAEDPNWARSVAQMAGVDLNTPVGEIPEEILLEAIARQEGWYAGREDEDVAEGEEDQDKVGMDLTEPAMYSTGPTERSGYDPQAPHGIKGELSLSAIPAAREQELQNGRIRLNGQMYVVVGSRFDRYLVPDTRYG